jgi:hypothetical protein
MNLPDLSITPDDQMEQLLRKWLEDRKVDLSKSSPAFRASQHVLSKAPAKS